MVPVRPGQVHSQGHAPSREQGRDAPPPPSLQPARSVFLRRPSASTRATGFDLRVASDSAGPFPPDTYPSGFPGRACPRRAILALTYVNRHLCEPSSPFALRRGLWVCDLGSAALSPRVRSLSRSPAAASGLRSPSADSVIAHAQQQPPRPGASGPGQVDSPTFPASRC